MREKLLDLMKSEGLKPSQLAEMLEINPAGISHILAGRNKPGFDLLQKMLTRFPRINPDWLILDSNQMYRDEASASTIKSFDSPTTSDVHVPLEKKETPSDLFSKPAAEVESITPDSKRYPQEKSLEKISSRSENVKDRKSVV